MNRSKNGPSQSLVAGKEIRRDLNAFGGTLPNEVEVRASELRDEVAYRRGEEPSQRRGIIMTMRPLTAGTPQEPPAAPETLEQEPEEGAPVLC